MSPAKVQNKNNNRAMVDIIMYKMKICHFLFHTLPPDLKMEEFYE